LPDFGSQLHIVFPTVFLAPAKYYSSPNTSSRRESLGSSSFIVAGAVAPLLFADISVMEVSFCAFRPFLLG
jgi:hypothetical protein